MQRFSAYMQTHTGTLPLPDSNATQSVLNTTRTAYSTQPVPHYDLYISTFLPQEAQSILVHDDQLNRLDAGVLIMVLILLLIIIFGVWRKEVRFW